MHVHGSAFALALEGSGGNGVARLRKHPHLERLVRLEGRKAGGDQYNPPTRTDEQAPARRMRGFTKRDLFRGWVVQDCQRLLEPAGGDGLPVSRNDHGSEDKSKGERESPGKPHTETGTAARRIHHREHTPAKRLRRLRLLAERRHRGDHGGRFPYALSAGGALLGEMLNDSRSFGIFGHAKSEGFVFVTKVVTGHAETPGAILARSSRSAVRVHVLMVPSGSPSFSAISVCERPS